MKKSFGHFPSFVFQQIFPLKLVPPTKAAAADEELKTILDSRVKSSLILSAFNSLALMIAFGQLFWISLLI